MKTIKLWLTTIATLLCSLTANAHHFEVGGIYYDITSTADLTVGVTYRGSSAYDYSNEYREAVTIPSTVTYNSKTYRVTSIEGPAFSGCSSLTSITIPESVTSIGSSTFYGCSSLTSIIVAEGNAKYDSRNGCNAIIETSSNTLIAGCSSTVIPESVTSIGSSAFYKCSSLTSITIPESVTSIGSYAFSGCSNLTSITIPENSQLTSIGYDAFYGIAWYNNQPDGVVYVGKVLYNYKGTMPANTSIEIKEGTVSINPYAFRGCSSLTSITIPESVTSIGSSAFEDCSSLTSITIPESVTSIGSSAFEDCSSLTSITIPESVTSIGIYAFSGCSNLTSITIPENSQLTSIGNSAFYGTAWYNNQPDGIVYVGKVLYKYKGTMPANTSIEIKEGIVSISPYAFEDCSSLTSITIPESVTMIGNWAFLGCSSLTAIIIPEGVTWIGESAFEDCSSLTSITIPESVTCIGGYAFEDCSSLTSIIVAEGNTKYDSRNGCNAIIETSSNTLIAGCSSTVIPESVTSIGSSAFYNCSSLTSITIPESVTSIGDNAFRGCSSLTSIIVAEGNAKYDSRNGCNAIIETSSNTLIAGCSSTVIPESVTSIGISAFYKCSSLTSITIPESVTSIGGSAFCDCSNLTSITIPENSQLTSIGNYAFYSCSSLTSITIPESVTSIGSSAFEDCSSLRKVINLSGLNIRKGSSSHGYVAYYAEKVITADDAIDKYCFRTSEESTHYLIAYYGNDSILNLPEDYHGDDYIIDIEAFAGDARIVSVYIPQTVGKIGSSAFAGCSKLVSVTIPRGVMSIGDNAFENCTSLTSIVIPQNMLAIGRKSFAGCSSLSSVEFKEGVETIGNNAFANCTSLATVIFPESLTAIGDEAFVNCTSLTDIVIPQNMLTIGSKSFAECSSLASVEFKEGVETIGKNAFVNCTSLATLIFPESLTAIGDGAFKGCSELKTILFSENIDTYGSNVFEGCDAVETMTVKGSVMPTVPSDKITSITLYSPVPLETAEFANKVYRNATVYVPQGSLERYQAANVWKNFWTIKEFDPTGIEQLTMDNGQLTIYDLSGRKIEVDDLRELEKGVYVVNGRKVLIND